MGPIAQKLPKKKEDDVTHHLLKALHAATQKPVQKFADGGATEIQGDASQVGQNLEHRLNPFTQFSPPGQQNFQGSAGLNNSAENPNTGVMGSIDGALGLNNNFVAQGANLTPGTNAAQLNTAYSQAQSGLGQQQALINALQQQNGIRNQSQVFNQLQGVASGTGPNPAQTMLNQQTGQNVANQAALMAGQRGASANSGLMARQIAMQGANTQQQAAGQGANLQANQSLNALNQLGGIAQNQVNQYGQAITGYNQAAQNEQNALQGANSAYNNSLVSMQSNMNNNNAMTAQGNQSARTGLFGGLMSGLSSTGGLMGAKGGEVRRYAEGTPEEPVEDVENQGGGDAPKNSSSSVSNNAPSEPMPQSAPPPQSAAPVNDGAANLGSAGYTPAPSSTAPSVGGSPSSLDMGASLKGGKGGGGGASGVMNLMALLAGGGPVTASMGNSAYMPPPSPTSANIGSSSTSLDVGKNLVPSPGDKKKKEPKYSGKEEAANGEADLGQYNVSEDSMMAAQGGNVDYRSGGHVVAQNESQKAVKAGNSYANDKIPAVLSEGEVVIPRDVMNSSDPVSGAAKFIQGVLAKKKAKGGEVKRYAEGTPDGPVDDSQVAQPTPDEQTPQQALNASDQVASVAADQAQQSNGNMAPTSQGMPSTPAGQLGSDPAYQQAYQKYYTDHLQELAQSNARFDQHLANGEITPETMHSLYAKKDTAGKIGTIFGLLAGGLGSGFTHQPNALLNIMQNQINNDLDAQKQSVHNAQNFLRINQAAERNKADMGMVNMQTAQGIQAKAYSQMSQFEFKKLADHLNSLPEGPQKQQGRQVLGWLWQQNNQKIASMFSQAAGAEAFLKTTGLGGGSPSPNQISQMKLMGPAGETMANELEQKTISGIPSVAGQKSVRPIGPGERNEITAQKILDDKGKDLLNFIGQHKGTLNPQQRAVATQKIEEMKNFYNTSIKGGALTEGRLGWYDEQFAKHPTDILPQMLGSTSKLKEMVNSNETRMNTNLKSMGFNPKAGDSSGSGTKEGAVGKSASGKPIVFKQGKWRYK